LRKINFDLIRPIVLKTLQNVDGILLHGSYARGDYSDESDLDLIIVTNSHCRTSYIKAKLEGELLIKKVSVTLLSAETFETLWKKGEIFILFGLTHGKVLLGESFFEDYSTLEFPFRENYKKEILKELRKVNVYEDYEKYDDCYRYPLSKLFVIFKKVAMFNMVEGRKLISNKRTAIHEYFKEKFTVKDVELILSFEKYTKENRPMKGSIYELTRAMELVNILRLDYDK